MSKPSMILDMDLRALRRLKWKDVWSEREFLSPEEIRHIFQTCDALWLHNGDPRVPHAELTSGKCSNGFVDVLRVLRYTNLCQILADQLVHRLHEQGGGIVDWVIGSDHAGATLSYTVAAHLNAQHDFTEKGPDKTQVWKRFQIKPGEIVLQVEELVTTTGTLKAVRQGIRLAHPHPVRFAPFSLCLVHRTPIYEFEGSSIVPLIHFDIQTWEPEQCPLCAQGSARVRPKQNWTQLTGR
ncbi:hypothetical protein HZA87_01080 [Candidatus Uhrbacteria bacterium]|nr:hypothetical protein [Candidatus Uhrbacteria bacterium]